jgi:DNA repair protein RecN (Recombination protein N)
MLLALHITNVAVIEESEVHFGPGLTVLTGETGAGKSILVDSLGLLLGGRADADVVRAGCEEASVEGLFLRSPALAARLAEAGLPDLGEEVSVRRVVGRAGRGKAYVNGALVTVGVLARLMRGAVDIAGQHEHVSLFDAGEHLSLLDRVGGLEAPLGTYRQEWAAVREVVARQDALGGDERKVRERAEFLRFQLDELTRASLVAGEDARLEEERKRLMGAEKLRRGASESAGLLSEEGEGALERVGRALALVNEAVKIDARLSGVQRALASASAELEEASRGLDRYVDGLQADPERLAEVDERLNTLKRLCRKHGCALEGLLQKQEALEAELSQLDNRQELLAQLEEERAAVEKRARACAERLSRARAKAAEHFSQKVREGLAGLALAHASFEARVLPGEALKPDGVDAVEFLFSANPGEPARPLAKVASGGEASRLLLGLKAALADSDACGSYVLDEADAGVSGAVADVVGRMIKDVAGHRQVLCITHLPQVAAYADAHLLIRKQLRGERTVSEVVPLAAGAERCEELARMLSGVEVTREALGAAEALVRAAQGRSSPASAAAAAAAKAAPVRTARPTEPAAPGRRARRSA